MISLDGVTAGALVMLMAAWLVAAAAATALGLRRAAAATAARKEVARLDALIAAAPMLPVRVTPDGHLDASERLAAWLGLARVPNVLADLANSGSGLSLEDAAALAKDVASAQRAARSFRRTLHVQGSQRVLLVQGQPAGEQLGRGVMLWFSDATESQSEIERLSQESARTARAVEGLSALIEAAPFPMWHRGPDLRLALVNSAYVRAVEAESAAEVVARGLELVEAAGGKGPLAAAAAARDEGEVSIRTAPATIAGERRTLRVVDVPLGEAGVAGYAVDVEELEEARADLGRFARAQRDMLDRLSAGVAQFSADRSLVFFNQHFLRLFAMKPEWLADHPEFDRVLERMREAQRVPESRDFPGWKAERRAWFNAAEEAIEENWMLPGGLHLRVVAQPLPDGGLMLIFEDRTEHVQLASARDTLLRVRAATFDNLFEAIGVFAADGRLHLWNSRFREVWGLTEEELAQHPRVDALVQAVAKKLVNPSRAGLIRELVRIATAERQQRSGRVALTDGRHFEFAAVPLPDGNALFTLLDITASRGIESALRERNEALEAADRLKTAFVANMSYELRVPLTSISGFAEMLAGGYAGPLDDTAKEYVGAILASVERLGSLIEDVLDLTQSEAGGLPMARETVDVAALARDAAAAAELAAKARPLDLALDIAPDIGTILGDKRRLRQAIDHLLRNAITYTAPGGRVLFRVGLHGDDVELIVSDNGKGIDARDRDRVFDHFHRSTMSAPRDGVQEDRAALGLGLPLTRQFVEAHGGTISLMSEPGQGTTVVVRLPRSGQAA
jgi:signal transduction histidine kinase